MIDMARHLTDAALNEEIVEARTALERIPAAGDCLGRRMAQARLHFLEDEMIRRYEAEMWGSERG